MASIRSPRQIATPTRLAVSPDQRLGVKDFLRSLKKPAHPLPTPKSFEALQDNASTSSQLTVQGFLHVLRKPMTSKPAEAAEAPKLEAIGSTGLEDLTFIDSAAPGLLESPESTPNERDSEQLLISSPEARNLRPPHPKGADEIGESMKIPKVTRTYTKKTKHVSPRRKDSPALFLIQLPKHERALLDGLPDDESDTTEQVASREFQPAKEHTLAVPQKRRLQPLQDDEEIHREDYGEYDADTVIMEKVKKTKRKKRRVAVNELALVKRLSSQEPSPARDQKVQDFDNAIDLLNEYLDGQGFSASTSPSFKRSRKQTRANTGKPVTRIRQGIAIPQRETLAREGFIFPPITPRATKSTGWRLGSGFEGVVLEVPARKRLDTSRNRRVRQGRTPSFLSQGHQPLPKLDLSTRQSPSRRYVGQSAISKTQKYQSGFVETSKYEPTRELSTAEGAVENGIPHKAAQTGGKSTVEQVAGLGALLRLPVANDKSRTASSSYRNGTIKEASRLHQGQNRDLDASHAIRKPSKSERTGWLKRRRVSFAVGDDDEEQLLFHTQRTSVNACDHERMNGRNGSYLEGTAQAPRAVYHDLQASNKGGQTASTIPNPKRTAISQQQDVFQGEQSAHQHQRVSHYAQEQISVSEEATFNYESSDCPPEPPPSSDFEADFPSSPSNSRALSMSKPRHQIQVPRTSEVLETQGRPRESIELDYTKTETLDPGPYSCRIPATTLDSGRYFSKVVQLLDSPEKLPHTVTRRKSRRELDREVEDSQVMFGTEKGAHHVNVALMTGGESFQGQEGGLELGVTPRLQRRMSTVPLKPPFREPL